MIKLLGKIVTLIDTDANNWKVSCGEDEPCDFLHFPTYVGISVSGTLDDAKCITVYVHNTSVNPEHFVPTDKVLKVYDHELDVSILRNALRHLMKKLEETEPNVEDGLELIITKYLKRKGKL